MQQDDERVPLRAFVLRGSDEALTQLVDWLHVHADVRGVVEEPGAVTIWLPAALPQLPTEALEVEELPRAQANASATGLENDRVIEIASDLIVRPPWVAAPKDFEGIELVVPRGMAFGSGEHDSTRAALLAMHSCWSAPQSFADIGTGSGILLSYAAHRGCSRLAACDIEAPAVAATRELVPAAEVVLGGPEQLPFAADFVVANMTGAELANSLEAILDHWTGRASLVLSGMRAHEVDGIAARLPCLATQSGRRRLSRTGLRPRRESSPGGQQIGQQIVPGFGYGCCHAHSSRRVRSSAGPLVGWYCADLAASDPCRRLWSHRRGRRPRRVCKAALGCRGADSTGCAGSVSRDGRIALDSRAPVVGPRS